MRYDQFNLNLNDNKRSNDVQKNIDSTFLYDDVTWGFEHSEGDRPADPFLPERFSPTVRTIKKISLQQKGVVIPRGTILSAKPVMNQDFYWRTTDNNFVVPGSGETLSGEVALGIGFDGSVLSSDIDDMVGGYDNIRLAGIIANGGITGGVNDTYHQHDVDRGRVDVDGTLVTTSTAFLRPANIPIGITTEDTYIWDQGNKLNFNEISWNPFRSYQTDFMVEMPYCADQTTYDMAATASGGTRTQGAAYTAVRALGMPFLTCPTLADMIVGNFVSSNIDGKFTTQYAAAAAMTGAKTVQTVGKLNSFTNKFPEDLEGLVETFHTTQTGGTATFGLKYNLFVFMNAILTSVKGSTPVYADYKDALDSGKFGMARVNLHVA